MKLQIFLSHNGVSSRRDAMQMIKDGFVQVNGKKIIEPSFEVDSQKDKVLVEGVRVKVKPYSYLLMNKPKGFETTKAKNVKDKIILDLLPPKWHHLSPVGRLDKDTEGLILLTNDGDLAHKMTHPRYDLEKTYRVRVEGQMTIETKQKLQRGVYLGPQKTSPCQITLGRRTKNMTELLVTIHEGKKRQIRRMMAKVKHKVLQLKRIAQGPLKLGGLKPGEIRFLTNKEIEALKSNEC